MIWILAILIVILDFANLSDYVPQIDEPQLMRVTCYTWTGNRTASGCYPYEGICASNRENLGKVAVVYDSEMNFVGLFEVKDTGGAKRLRNGTSIDIYRNDMDSARQWIRNYGDYMYVVFIDAKG